MEKTVAVLGTFDTKAEALACAMDSLRRHGLAVVAIDLGTGESTGPMPDCRAATALAGRDLSAIDRVERMRLLGGEAAAIANRLVAEDKLHGVLALGGGQGTFLANQVLRTLPVGFPKFLLSVVAHLEGSSKQFLGLADTVVMNSLVDITGLNDILRGVINQAAAALAGMVLAPPAPAVRGGKKTAVAISCWGVTTPCVERIRAILEQSGCEVYVFHANGDGGKMLVKLVKDGKIDAVADVTLSEVSMPLAGAPQKAVAERLSAAAKRGVPQVLAPGGLDMLLSTPELLQTRHGGRPLYRHTADVAFARSTAEENRMFARAIAGQVNQTTGPVAMLLPLGGLSQADAPGGPLYDPGIDRALFEALKGALTIPVVERGEHINDPAFAEAVAETLLGFLQNRGTAQPLHGRL